MSEIRGKIKNLLAKIDAGKRDRKEASSHVAVLGKKRKKESLMLLSMRALHGCRVISSPCHRNNTQQAKFLRRNFMTY